MHSLSPPAPPIGYQVGLIPDTPASRLLYDWLAAFNQASYPALGNALPNVVLVSARRYRDSPALILLTPDYGVRKEIGSRERHLLRRMD